jgi:protein transporter SFT1
VAKAQAGLKSTMRRLNRNLAQRGLNPVVIVVLFALFCFFCVFLWSKFQRRR